MIPRSAPTKRIQVTDVQSPVVATVAGTAIYTISGGSAGMRLHNIRLTGNSGTAKVYADMVSAVRLKVKGNVQRNLTAAQLKRLAALWGTPFALYGDGSAATWSISVPLSEMFRKDVESIEAFAYDVLPGEVIQLEVDVLATSAAGAVLRVDVLQAPLPPDAAQLQRGIVRQIPAEVAVAGTSADFFIRNLGSGLLQSVHFNSASGGSTTITGAIIKIDGEEVFNQTYAQMAGGLTEAEGTPDAAWYDWILDALDNARQGRPISDTTKIEVHLDFSGTASGTVKFLTQIYSQPV